MLNRAIEMHGLTYAQFQVCMHEINEQVGVLQ